MWGRKQNTLGRTPLSDSVHGYIRMGGLIFWLRPPTAQHTNKKRHRGGRRI
jgi:hypothetical protein